MRTDSGQIVRLEDYAPSDYLIPRTGLTFRLGNERTIVVAELTIERRDGVDASVPLVLDGDGLELISLQIDGEELARSAYEASSQRLVIHEPPTRFTLTIETAIAPATNETLMGLYRSSGVYCTQCEAEGFRRITYFLDRPDILSVYTVRIEALKAQAPVLLSNGDPVERGDLDGARHFAVWHDPFPKPSYLFALVAGDLARVSDSFVTMSGRTIDLGIYVEHGKEKRAAYAMDALKRSMRWDEEVFGREYDLGIFNIVAVSDFNFGAMENKGLNIFNDKYILADRETATDFDFANIEAIVAHEYFHNWTGNRITCRDWFQLCLKEGLTVFRDHEFSADERERTVRRIADVKGLKAQQFPEDQGPLAHPVRPRRYREINNFYTATVYQKGGEIVRMLRTLIGPVQFRAAMDLYFERHDGQAVTIEDFLRVFEDAAQIDLSQFSLWYHQAGTPHVAVKTSYDARRRSFSVELEQSMPPTPSEQRKRLLHIPLAFGLVGADGKDANFTSVDGGTVSDGVIHLKRRRQVFRFNGVNQKPVLSINRGFSAPITITSNANAEDRQFLAQHDSDGFGRWQALNDSLLSGLIAAARGKKAPVTAVTTLLGNIAADESLQPAYRALMLSLPTDADIARELGDKVNPDAVFAAREDLLAAIANENAATFATLYQAVEGGTRFRPDAASAGKRALRNVLLDYLSKHENSPQRAATHLSAATNLTDRFAALSVLVHRFGDTDEARDALANYERQFGNDPLAMDKWFQVQATAPGFATIETVRTLMRHPHFAITNPNRVRALVFTFASANQTAFHAASGDGYRLLAETVLEVDPRNPQLAAKLATNFRSWRSVDAKRQALARKALMDIASRNGLSPDLRDIVERTLT
ncbi:MULTISPECIES: aminopeptidase N [Mesorhizobium]|uniref:Aminopeptidase N n=1 Tax=Mesorhizobium denitrificans TaxID=2294114 RepID=A0A371XHQ6_9HYPH|nr:MULTISPECIES: aminopeptidase N [Mesorhizobium]RFC68733.1 aminopeptidase N [Mesorhizobium denitrificans]